MMDGLLEIKYLLYSNFYVDKSGKILNTAEYEKIRKKFNRSGVINFPFAQIVITKLLNKRQIKPSVLPEWINLPCFLF